jgi:hypothetical protein
MREGPKGENGGMEISGRARGSSGISFFFIEAIACLATN